MRPLGLLGINVLGFSNLIRLVRRREEFNLSWAQATDGNRKRVLNVCLIYRILQLVLAFCFVCILLCDLVLHHLNCFFVFR